MKIVDPKMMETHHPKDWEVEQLHIGSAKNRVIKIKNFFKNPEQVRAYALATDYVNTVSGQFSNLTIGILGDIFILARISHAYGIFQAESSSMFRTVGAVTSMVVLLIQAWLALWVSGAWLAANNWGF